MDFASIFGAIGDAIETIGSTIAGYLNLVLPILWNDIKAVADALSKAVAELWSALSNIWDWLSNAWKWLHDHIIGPILDWIRNITEWFGEWLAPLKAWVNQIIQMYKWYYLQILKPMLDIIQRIRFFLVLLQLAGVKWAAQLDSYLTEVETKIQESFLAVLSNLNILASWINFIVDPFGNIQGAVLLGSISPIAGAIYATLWGLQNGSISAAGAANAQQLAYDFTTSGVQTGTIQELTGVPQPEDQPDVLAIDAAMAALDNPIAIA